MLQMLLRESSTIETFVTFPQKTFEIHFEYIYSLFVTCLNILRAVQHSCVFYRAEMSVTHLQGSKRYFFCGQSESRKFRQKKCNMHILPGMSFLQLICFGKKKCNVLNVRETVKGSRILISLKKKCNVLKVREIVKRSRKTSLTRFQCFPLPLSLQAMQSKMHIDLIRNVTFLVFQHFSREWHYLQNRTE